MIPAKKGATIASYGAPRTCGDDPPVSIDLIAKLCAPRTCGDDPQSSLASYEAGECSPHMRG